MLATEEMRWFFAETMPESVTAWFGAQICAAQVCIAPTQPPRTDYYLRLADSDSLGIKLRQGRIETKQREGTSTLVQLGERAAGQVESWRKWSFELVETGESVTDAAQWVGVWKARRWCLFTVGENGRIIPAPPTTILEQGCACELTDVRLADSSEPWWSLGFEAFGGTAVDRRERLLLVAKQFLRREDAPLLAAEHSYSYPKWLQMTS
jgi:hypothetical protein